MDFFLRFLLIFSFLLITKSSFTQTRTIEQGLVYFSQDQFSFAEDIFDYIYYVLQDDEALYYSALCSKNLAQNDAKYKLQLLLDNHPNSFFIEDVYLALAQLYYLEQNYFKTIESYQKTKKRGFLAEDIFKLGHSYFLLDSLDQASYYFTKLYDSESKFSAIARYYFAHIAYKQGFYDASLKEFQKLVNEPKFRHIVPYYISQIYFFQKDYIKLTEYVPFALKDVISSRKSEITRVLAEAYYQLGDFEKSIQYFEEYFSYIEQPESIDYFQVGHSYFYLKDYLNAIKYLERVDNVVDSIKQFSTYHLAGSYLFLDKKQYALNAFKLAATFDYNSAIKEDAFYNYVKLSFELDLPFDNTLEVLETYLSRYDIPKKREHIESLIIEILQKTTNYDKAYLALKKISKLSNIQKEKLQQVTFFLGVISYNKRDFKKAILFFNESQQYDINSKIFLLSRFWEADSYYRLGDFLKSVEIYGELNLLDNDVLNKYLNLQMYNYAYGFFKLENYDKSNQLFRSYIEESKDSMRLNDSYLRIADGFFMKKEFLLSQEYYEKAYSIGLFDVDYALYQQAVCLGLQGDRNKRKEILNIIIKEHQESSYFDDALLDLAMYYKEINNSELALFFYDTLLYYTKDFETQSNIFLSKGMIYFNNNKIDLAIQSLKYVIQNFEATKSFNEALSALQAIYVTSGNVDDYVEFLKDIPQANISRSKQDSLTYHTAFIKFSNNEFIEAKTIFIKYLNDFTSGSFINEAHFFLAESNVNLGDTISALDHYSYIIENNVHSYLERSLIVLSRYFYATGNYKEANTYYMLLEEIASTNSLKREIIIRLMYINEKMNPVQAFKYAIKVLSMKKVDDILLSKSNMIIARKEFEDGNYSKASKTFERIRSKSKGDDGAEASFMLSYLSYLNEDYITSETIIFDLAENYYNDYFIARGFLLLAKIYKNQGNRLQAKATLESIINNYSGSDLVDKAVVLRSTIIAEEIEEKNKTFEEKQSYINILEDNIDYELDNNK